MGKQNQDEVHTLLHVNPDLAKQWHSSRNLPLTPGDVSPNSNKKVWWTCEVNTLHVWLATVQSRNSGKGCGLCRGLVIHPGVNDLVTLFPEIAREWDFERNLSTAPSVVSPTSSKKFWWRCPLEHSYQLSVESRVKGSSCQVCSNRVILPGFNDLSTKFPEISREFASDLNGGLQPSGVGSGSGSSYWWRCGKGHTWKAKVTNRTALKSSCPFCSGNKVFEGESDFGTLFPDLLSQWSDLNEQVKPSDLSKSSTLMVWWDCEKGHSWKATVADRTRGQGCAVCYNRQVIKGVNDFGSTHPHLVDQVDSAKNPTELAFTMPAGTPRKLWWVCLEGHSWEAGVKSRALDNQGCPYCSGNLVISGVNDLETLNPDLAQEWNYLRNDLSPTEVKSQSMKKVWWLCRRGHEWHTTIRARSNGTGCPYCSNVRVLEGFNDLATAFPEIAETWDTAKNSKRASEIMPGSHSKYWWKCSKQHSWEASPNKRIQGRNCPTCAPSGFVPGKPGVLYFLEHKRWSSFKIGITNTAGHRLKSLSKDGWVPLQLLTFEVGAHAEKIEGECLSWVRNQLHLPPYLPQNLMTRTGGWTETFSSELVTESEVREFIADAISRNGFEVHG